MPGSFNVSQVWFACEAMTPLQRLILGELLRQCFSPVDFYRAKERVKSLPPSTYLLMSARSLNAIEFAQIDDYQFPLARN